MEKVLTNEERELVKKGVIKFIEEIYSAEDLKKITEDFISGVCNLVVSAGIIINEQKPNKTIKAVKEYLFDLLIKVAIDSHFEKIGDK